MSVENCKHPNRVVEEGKYFYNFYCPDCGIFFHSDGYPPLIISGGNGENKFSKEDMDKLREYLKDRKPRSFKIN